MTADSPRAPVTAFWNGTPVKTYLFDAFSILLPAAEAFMIEVVDDAQQRLHKHSPLRAKSASFMADELSHQRAHRLYNQRLQAQGYRVDGFERRIAADLASLKRALSPQAQLAFIAAGEHLTAVVAGVALGRTGLLPHPDRSHQARLWHWHCQEEIAHRHVTAELLQALGVPYWQRMAWYLAVSGVILFDMLRHMHSFARTDLSRGRTGTMDLLRDMCRFAWNHSGDTLRLGAGWMRYLLPMAWH